MSTPVTEGPLSAELTELLATRNGFYACESALHVLPDGATSYGCNLQEWNDPAGWRREYGGMVDGLVCFAEDVFGGQFAVRGDEIVTFDPETGDIEAMANSVEEWAEQILADFKILTGHPVGRQWQLANRALAPDERLVPTVPFVLGGDYVIDNLIALDAATGMRLRSELAMQLIDLPDGTTVRVRYRAVD